MTFIHYKKIEKFKCCYIHYSSISFGLMSSPQDNNSFEDQKEDNYRMEFGNTSFYLNLLPPEEEDTTSSFYVNILPSDNFVCLDAVREKEFDEKESEEKESDKQVPQTPFDYKTFFDNLDMRQSFYFSAEETEKIDPEIFGSFMEESNDPLSHFITPLGL